jgi:hypothetical protein
MTGLLPDAVRDAVQAGSDRTASESFGLVALVLLMIILIYREVLRAAGTRPAQALAFGALAMPLVVAGLLTIGYRVADLFPK